MSLHTSMPIVSEPFLFPLTYLAGKVGHLLQTAGLHYELTEKTSPQLVQTCRYSRGIWAVQVFTQTRSNRDEACQDVSFMCHINICITLLAFNMQLVSCVKVIILSICSSQYIPDINLCQTTYRILDAPERTCLWISETKH